MHSVDNTQSAMPNLVDFAYGFISYYNFGPALVGKWASARPNSAMNFELSMIYALFLQAQGADAA